MGTSTITRILTTTDHKVIGSLYLATSFAFFLLAGALAMLIRMELWAPGLQVVDNPEQFNQLFTMHGTLMLLLFATPLFVGFGNALAPLQIGAADVAFPRLNMFSYWLFRFGGLIVVSGALTAAGPRPSAGRATPRSRRTSTHPASAGTCGWWGWRSVASARSSARSTSSRRSCACARPG